MYRLTLEYTDGTAKWLFNSVLHSFAISPNVAKALHCEFGVDEVPT